MVGNQEGIGILKLECPQMHPVGRILKEAPYQAVVYDPGAQVGDRRFWPDEDDQPHEHVDDPSPVHAAAEQRRVHQLVKPVLRRPFGDVLYRLREQADRDEQPPDEPVYRICCRQMAG